MTLMIIWSDFHKHSKNKQYNTIQLRNSLGLTANSKSIKKIKR